MTGLPKQARCYLDKRGMKGPWGLGGEVSGPFYGAVVIPSLAEGESLFETLGSLAKNPPEFIERFLVVVVINQSEIADQGIRTQNEKDLSSLAEYAKETCLHLAWVDAASVGLAFPAKQAGVGAARKLGLDIVLPWLDWRDDPLLVCLDADTLVDNNYLAAICQHFQVVSAGAAVLPFRHQPAPNTAQQAAIDRYELFLRSYVFGLSLAGSPYAFNTVGSAMACRASAYLRCGGMNTRQAGEDYYFLQKLAKTDGVAQLKGTTVCPQPRASDRVPFGTGRSMARLMAGEVDSVLFYPVEVFQVLGAWLALVTDETDFDAESLLKKASHISSHLSSYLEQSGWLKHWPELQKNHSGREARLRAFHVWFDGFRSLRLMHLLCEAGYKRGEPEDLLPAYFAWQGQCFSGGVTEALAALRAQDAR